MTHIYQWLRSNPNGGKPTVMEDHYTMVTIADKKAVNRRRRKQRRATRQAQRR